MKFKEGDIVLLSDLEGARHFAELHGYDEYHGIWGIVYFTNLMGDEKIGEADDIAEDFLHEICSGVLDPEAAKVFRLLWT